MLLSLGSLSADEFHESFDGEQPDWKFDGAGSAVMLRSHDRTDALFHSAPRCERVVLRSQQFGAEMQLSRIVPPAQVFDALSAGLWVRGSHPGVRLALVLRFPHQIDPRTDQPLTASLMGEPYTQVNTWQQLTCRASEANTTKLVARLRAQILNRIDASDLDLRDMYVDEVRLVDELDVGETVFHLDDLQFGPVVSPRRPDLVQSRDDVRAQPHRVTMGDDRLLLDERPFFPVFLPYHGENIDLLARTGANVIWTPDAEDAALLQAIAGAGLYVMAGVAQPQEDVSAAAAGLVPFGEQTAPVIFWNCGTRIPGARLPMIDHLADQVRDADRDFERLIWADVAGREREVHRKVDVLGTSRFFLQTEMNPREYADYLVGKRQLALPGKPTYTFVQTEPEDGHFAGRAADGRKPVVEPEQIQLQAWTAVAAGFKGIGFWTQGPLDSGDPAVEERRLAITLFCLHARLLERWLAAGKLDDRIPVLTSEQLAASSESRPGAPRGFGDQLRSRWSAILNANSGGRPSSEQAPIQASLIRSEYGVLVVPVWYEPQAQYQPGAMTARHLRLLVRPKIGTAQVFEVSPTGVRSLPVELEPVDGGTEVHLPEFDRYATLVITSDLQLIESLKRDVRQMRQPAAEAWIQLASLKLERVAEVHAELASLAPTVASAATSLTAARRHLDAARIAIERQMFDEARLESGRALELTRSLQRAHWDLAAARLSRPSAGPHAYSFQTLPDHWRLMARLGRASSSQNLLPHGDFEQSDANGMVTAGWRYDPSDAAAIRCGAELAPRAYAGKRCLRMAAVPVDSMRPPISIDEPPVRVVTPPLPVAAGQIVHVSGRIQIVTPITGHPDGFVFFDSLKGTVAAQRWRAASPRGEWESFDLFREIPQDGVFAVTMELRGLGEVWIDDLKMVTLDPPADAEPVLIQPAAVSEPSPPRGLRRYLDLRR